MLIPKLNKSTTSQSYGLILSPQESDEKRSSSSNKLAFYDLKYPKIQYTKIERNANDPNGPKLLFEAEGIPLRIKSISKEITYFECNSSRQRNAPECNFRGRYKNFNVQMEIGEIEVIAQHSSTCKYIIGNNVTDMNKNKLLYQSKATFKIMKTEIEKKLENSSWLTPKEVLDWIQKEFTIDCHLSYSQVEGVVKEWRKKNFASKEEYVLQNSTNKTGLPFLRAHLVFNYQKNNITKTAKIIIWASDFQINRLRLTRHWYIDGTFTITPSDYYQLLTVVIRDPNTGYIKPALWAVLGSKEEETYYQAFKMIYDISSRSGTLDWSLESVTLDFEAGLINGFKRIFKDSRIIGCLFHFKQALYREAQVQGLTTNDLKEETKSLISSLGSLSWKGDISLVEEELEKITEKYKENHSKLTTYYKNCWLQRLKTGLIDYSHVEDEYRANSVLESYNSHVKDLLTRSSSWPLFIEFLRNEEANYVNEVFLAEQKGQTHSKSVNFGKVYLPKQISKVIFSKGNFLYF